jgi:hypothetical protein
MSPLGPWRADGPGLDYRDHRFEPNRGDTCSSEPSCQSWLSVRFWPRHLTNYEPIIDEVATQTAEFGRPVLMFNGDSHLYRSDNPLSFGAACTGETDPATGTSVCAHDPGNNSWNEHPYYDVPNFHRVVVHGSTTPLEWLELTVDPNANTRASDTAFGPFSWQRMPQPQL